MGNSNAVLRSFESTAQNPSLVHIHKFADVIAAHVCNPNQLVAMESPYLYLYLMCDQLLPHGCWYLFSKITCTPSRRDKYRIHSLPYCRNDGAVVLFHALYAMVV